MTDTDWAPTMTACLTACINDDHDLAEQLLAETCADDVRSIALEAMSEQVILLRHAYEHMPVCECCEPPPFAEWWAQQLLEEEQ